MKADDFAIKHFNYLNILSRGRSEWSYIITESRRFLVFRDSNMLEIVLSILWLSLKACGLLFFFVCSKISILIPAYKKLISEKFKDISALNDESEFEDKLFGWKMFKSCLKLISTDHMKTARIAEKAPNPRVIDFSETEHKLLDFAKPGRPLVLNFGSCS